MSDKIPPGRKVYFSTNSWTDDEYFLVSEEDYERVKQYTWCVTRNPTKGGYKFYIRTAKRINKTKVKQIPLHRLIFQEELRETPHLMVDHPNDWRDNRRGVIRICDKSGNNRNKSPTSRHSPYLGVHYSSPNDKKSWRARCCVRCPTSNKKQMYYGPYRETAEEAAVDYDLLALTRHGEFANLNFPEDWKDLD